MLLNKGGDLVVFVSVCRLFDSLLPMNFFALFPISDNPAVIGLAMYAM